MVAVFIIIAVLAAGGIGYMIHAAQTSYERKIEDLERTLAEQAKRLEDLEQVGSQKVRNPYLTNVGIEDAIAILHDVTANHEYTEVRLNQARSILGQVRSDPSHYDEDKPNGKKAW